MWVLFPFLGGAISILSGFFGIGGGFILTPLLLLSGYSPVEAISISLLFSIGSSLSGAFAHLKMGNVYWRIAIIIGLSGIVATQFAQPFVMWLEANKYDDIVIPILYIVLLGYFALRMISTSRQQTATTIEKERGHNPLWKLLVIGFLGGFVSTTLGVGGGFLMVPLLITLVGLPAKRAVGTSLVAVLFIVLSGFFTYFFRTDVEVTTGLLLVVGTLFGAPVGAKITNLYVHREVSLWLGALYIMTIGSVISELLNLATVGIGLMSVFFVSFITFTMKKYYKLKRLHSHEGEA